MKKIKNDIKKTYFLTFVLIIIFYIVFFVIFNKKVLPILVNYANIQTKRLGIEVLKTTGIDEINKMLKNQEVFSLTKTENEQIESIDFNMVFLNEVLAIVSKNIRNKFLEIEEGKNIPKELYINIENKKIKKGIVYEVPVGVAFGNTFLANMGSKIPIKITYSGNVSLDIKTRVSEYGINSALIEVFIRAEVVQRTIAPFITEDVNLVSEIPLAIKVVKGNVPNYLLGTKDYENLSSIKTKN